MIREVEGKPRSCIIGLPGRGVPVKMMDEFVQDMELTDSMSVILEPQNLRWYPQPNGPADQKDAVDGLADAVYAVNLRINMIQRAFRIKRSRIAVVGYSAGSVVALQMLAAADKPYAAVVSFAGAILEPGNMPKAKTQTPVLLRHAIDDDCFEWQERYVPMKESLLTKDYNLFVSESMDGGHNMRRVDATLIGSFLKTKLGYKEDGE